MRKSAKSTKSKSRKGLMFIPIIFLLITPTILLAAVVPNTSQIISISPNKISNGNIKNNLRSIINVGGINQTIYYGKMMGLEITLINSSVISNSTRDWRFKIFNPNFKSSWEVLIQSSFFSLSKYAYLVVVRELSPFDNDKGGLKRHKEIESLFLAASKPY